MKRFLILLAALIVSSGLVSCNAPKNEARINDDKTVVAENSGEESKEESKNEIVLDIKELEEVDEVTLGEAAAALGFENEKLFHAVANAMGISPFEMKQEDLDKVHYIAIGPEETGYSVFIGYIDYVDRCFSEDASTQTIMQELNELVMMSVFEYDKETDSLSDLGNFRNVEMFEIYDVKIDDISFIKNYSILALGYFKNNGITDVSALSDFNPETLIELDLTGNNISDWTPLGHIKEKVTVFYGVSDGMPITISLESMLEQKEQNKGGEDAGFDEGEVAGEQGSFELVDENGEAVDFSSLFE